MVLHSTRWLALSYFTYFFSYGIFLPFWSVWLKGAGLSPETIGLLLGAGSSLVMTILALAGVEGFVGHAPMIGVIGMLISLAAVPIVSLCTASKGHFGNLMGMKNRQ